MKHTQSIKTAWHYTTAIGFVNIIADKKINLSTIDIGKDELPVVWFSVNQIMEMTIKEMAWGRQDGTCIRPRNAAEFRILGLGLYRIGLPTSSLIRYAELARGAKISLARRRNLEKIAIKVGSNPFEWFGSFSAIPFDRNCLIQSFDGSKWIDLPIETAMDYSIKEQEKLIIPAQEIINGNRKDKVPSSFERIL